jgi:UDP-N-acetylmuramoylalanine--D-glutamate ligase
VVLIGRDRDRDCHRVESTGVSVRATDMHEAVPRALPRHTGRRAAVTGVRQLDMFRNYEHRAQVFVDEVKI